MTHEIASENLEFARFIRPGDAVVVGQACAEPLTLTEALAAQRAAIGGCRVFLGPAFAGTFRPEHADHLAFTAYAASGSNQALARAGKLDILPCHYSALPRLFASGKRPVDAVLMQVCPAAAGAFSLGLAYDHLIDAARRARVVIAELNEEVPDTPGSALPADIRVDVLVRTSRAPAMLQ